MFVWYITDFESLKSGKPKGKIFISSYAMQVHSIWMFKSESCLMIPPEGWNCD